MDPKEENKVDGKLLPVADPMLEKIKNIFLQDYFPVREYRPGVIFKSTSEIYNDFFRLYPNAAMYSSADIAIFLNLNGYHVKNMGDLRYEWMLMPAPTL